MEPLLSSSFILSVLCGNLPGPAQDYSGPGVKRDITTKAKEKSYSYGKD